MMIPQWLKETTNRKREEALRDIGRHEGRAQAFSEVLDLLDEERHCQVCGESFWSKETKYAHYDRHPDHDPNYVAQKNEEE